jgi:hypothetical protein
MTSLIFDFLINISIYSVSQFGLILYPSGSLSNYSICGKRLNSYANCKTARFEQWIKTSGNISFFTFKIIVHDNMMVDKSMTIFWNDIHICLHWRINFCESPAVLLGSQLIGRFYIVIIRQVWKAVIPSPKSDWFFITELDKSHEVRILASKISTYLKTQTLPNLKYDSRIRDSNPIKTRLFLQWKRFNNCLKL